jgi:two-component SAPR family response regulator
VSEQFSLDLLGGFALRHGDRAIELPPACQRLVAVLALKHRPVHRLWVCAILWPQRPTHRAAASLRSAMWRLRPVGAEPVLVVDAQYLALSPDVAVDWYEATDRMGRLLDGDETAAADPQWVADLLPLLRAGDLLPGWTEKWAVRERVQYRTMRTAVLDIVGPGPEKQAPRYACGSIGTRRSGNAALSDVDESSEP